MTPSGCASETEGSSGASLLDSAAREVELHVTIGRDQVEPVRVARDVLTDERADRDHGGALLTGLLEGGLDELATEALALELGIDLGVAEGDRAVVATIGGVSGPTALDLDREAPRIRLVDDLGRRR